MRSVALHIAVFHSLGVEGGFPCPYSCVTLFALEDALWTVPPWCSECSQHPVHLILKCRKDLSKHTIKLGCFLCRKILNYELKNFNGYKLFCFQPEAQCCPQFCTVSWMWQKPLRIRVSWLLGKKRAKHPGCPHIHYVAGDDHEILTLTKWWPLIKCIHFIKVVRCLVKVITTIFSLRLLEVSQVFSFISHIRDLYLFCFDKSSQKIASFIYLCI